jgi:ADP-ribosyl-[dinitrogen reductase] hydrolase
MSSFVDPLFRRFSSLLVKRTSLSVKERRAGMWRGLGLGDKNGGPTQMALRLKQSLESLHRFCPDDIFSRYYSWWLAEGFDTGPTAGGVFELVQAGLPRDEATRQIHEETEGGSAGCNPAHRASPLAMMDFLPLNNLSELARQEARLTHLHPDAGEASAAVVLLCRYLIEGMAWTEALQCVAAQVQGSARLALLDPNVCPLDRSGHAPEVLRAAIAFVSASRNFTSALQASMDFAGPSNYCPVLVGAIAGARWGG